MFTCNRTVFGGLKQKLSCCSGNKNSHHFNDPNAWRFNSNDRSVSALGGGGETHGGGYTRYNSRGATDKVGVDEDEIGVTSTTSSMTKQKFPPHHNQITTNPHNAQQIPSRYGSRSKTMYTLSKTQASDTALNINSFNGRYY